MRRIIFESIAWSLLAVVGLVGLVLVIRALVFMPAPEYNYTADDDGNIFILFFTQVFAGLGSLIAMVTSLIFLGHIKSRAKHAFHKRVQSVENALFAKLSPGESLPSDAVTHNFKLLQEWVVEIYPNYVKARREAKEKKKELKQQLTYYNPKLD